MRCDPVAGRGSRNRDENGESECGAELLRCVEESRGDSHVRWLDAGGGAEGQRYEDETEAEGEDELRAEDVAPVGALQIDPGQPQQTRGGDERAERREQSRADLGEGSG